MNEIDHRFKQPFTVWFVSIVNAMAAIVQGRTCVSTGFRDPRSRDGRYG